VPGQRLKYEQYFPYLLENGFECQIAPFFDQKTLDILYRKGNYGKKLVGTITGVVRRFLLIPRVIKADGVYVALHVFPIGPSILDTFFVKLAKKVIYDIDDMVQDLETNQQNKIARLFKTSKRYRELMKHANFVITCTPHLDQIAKTFNPHTLDISSTIDTNVYVPTNCYKNDHKLVIGWTGSHSTTKYLLSILDILRVLSKSRSFQLLVMGASHIDCPDIDLKMIKWSNEVEIDTLRMMDIGLYPLIDDNWAKGKSGLKAIQYMGMGIPVVASNAGYTARVVQDKKTGYIVETPDEWLTALTALLDDARLRQSLGEAGRIRVEEHFSLQANRHKYLDVFRTVYCKEERR